MLAKSYFIGDYNIVDKTANRLTTKLKECFEETEIDIAKVMALGSDGAAPMTGCKNGVGVQLRRVNPFMIQFHCAVHKLALCTAQAADSVSLMQKYKDSLRSIEEFPIIGFYLYHVTSAGQSSNWTTSGI